MAIYTVTAMYRHYHNEHLVPDECDTYRIGLILKKFREFFGVAKAAADVTMEDLSAYMTLRYSEGMTGSTIRRELRMHYAACNWAKGRKRIKEFEKIKLPAPGAPRTRYLESEECERVMAAARSAGEVTYRFYLIALETAARSEAIEQLQVGRVDFRRNVIDFRVPGKRYKNKRRGEVAISDHLREELRAWCADRRPTEYVIGCNRKGEPLRTGYRCKKVMKAAGIDERGVCRHVTRKTWASHAVINDVPIKRVAVMLHDRVDTVDKAYAHLSVAEMHDTVNFRKPRAELPEPV